MNLDEGQRKKVSAWIAEGLKISEIQTRLASEFGLRLTYMDVRFLVDDLKLVPKDVEPAQPSNSVLQSASPAKPPAGKPGSHGAPALSPEPEAASAGGEVSVSVDTLARPGAMASGKVTFSDGQTADWYFDQSGRLGMVPPKPGYRPAPEDVQAFQQALDRELSRLGL